MQTESNIMPLPKETPQHHVREAVNPRTGRRERVFVNLEAVYPDYKNANHEICFEELRAASRGWLKKDWSKPKKPLKEIQTNAAGRSSGVPSATDDITDRSLAQDVKQKLALGEGSSRNDHRDRRLSKVKKIKVKEVGETQTSKFSATRVPGCRMLSMNSQNQPGFSNRAEDKEEE